MKKPHILFIDDGVNCCDRCVAFRQSCRRLGTGSAASTSNQSGMGAGVVMAVGSFAGGAAAQADITRSNCASI